MFERTKKTTIGQIIVELTFKLNLSFWDSIKLRIAGKNAEPVVLEMVKKIQEVDFKEKE